MAEKNKDEGRGLPVLEIKDVSSNVVVHGVITSLSPIKEGSLTKRKFFYGTMSVHQRGLYPSILLF